MLDIFGSLRRALRRRTIAIDNAIFRLHWLLTSVILIAFSLIVTARQYVGNPIDCMQTDKIPQNVLNTYCWIHSTFTIPSAFRKKVGVDVPYPGIDNSRNSDKKFYAYYQWVCFVLFLQGTLFYVPYYLWKLWEGGLMKAVSVGLQVTVFSEEERNRKKTILIEYLVRHLRCHRMYALKYFFCEFLCLVNVVGQMYLMDCFFDGEFFTYGIEVIKYAYRDQEERLDPMIFVFPRMTKCTFHTFGSSGDIQRHDAFCLLPLNIVNEKLYVFLWFWFIILAVLTLSVLLIRLSILFAPSLRPRFLRGRCRLAHEEDLKLISKKTNIGDWFVLYMLGKNIDPIFIREIVSEMAKQLERAKPGSEGVVDGLVA